ncbi:MAG: ACP S-malonyltransferase [Planctomycetes bacterium]|nr:ACP S-malonyltransferase [Planctomycetota bacterium]
MKGILADANITGPIESLVHQMQSGTWVEFWTALGLQFKRFDDLGLSPDASDFTVWQTCQSEHLILITANRNKKSADSLEETILQYNQPDSLPVFTISNMEAFGASRTYAEKVLEHLYDYLLRIDEFRGTGRLYLPQKQ